MSAPAQSKKLKRSTEPFSIRTAPRSKEGKGEAKVCLSVTTTDKRCFQRAGDVPAVMDHVGAAGFGPRHKAAQSPVTITLGAQYLIVHDGSLGRPKTRFGDGPGQKRATRSEASTPLRNDLHVASIFNYFIRLSQEGAAGGE